MFQIGRVVSVAPLANLFIRLRSCGTASQVGPSNFATVYLDLNNDGLAEYVWDELYPTKSDTIAVVSENGCNNGSRTGTHRRVPWAP